MTSSASGRQATQRHSSKLRGRRAALATIGLVLLVAGCGSPSADRSRSERPAARPADTDLVYAADPAHGQVKVVGAAGRVLRTLPAGVPSPDWRTLYVAGGGADRTTVRAVDVASGRELRSTTIPGKFRLPVVGTAGIPDGLSGDGRTLALVNVADLPVRRFAILPTDFSERPQMVDLPGDFDFDALSPDGARLFVVEHLAGPDRSAYRVRFYDRDAGKLDPNVIVDKRDAWETSMAGYPNTRVVEPGGDWVYTLYRNADNGPFVHALNASDAYAFCIDLPRTGGGGGDGDRTARLWTLVRGATAGRLYAVNSALGLVSEIDAGREFTVLRSASFAPERPAGGAPGRPGSVVLGDGGDLLLVAGADGVTAIGTGSLKVQRRILAGWAVDGLVASADGRRVYALGSARGRVAAIDPASGTLLGERPVPTATFLLRSVPAGELHAAPVG